jgi:hypothetical protein
MTDEVQLNTAARLQGRSINAKCSTLYAPPAALAEHAHVCGTAPAEIDRFGTRGKATTCCLPTKCSAFLHPSQPQMCNSVYDLRCSMLPRLKRKLHTTRHIH